MPKSGNFFDYVQLQRGTDEQIALAILSCVSTHHINIKFVKGKHTMG